jgi:hypothetical protein
LPRPPTHARTDSRPGRIETGRSPSLPLADFGLAQPVVALT